MEDSLLAIIGVPKEDRVLCQFKECNHPIYKSIHIVNINEELLVIGSTCYKKHFHSLIKTNVPIFTSTDGKTLSDEERELLRRNTVSLIRKLKIDYQNQIELDTKEKIEAELKAQKKELQENLNNEIITPKYPHQQKLNFFHKNKEKIDEHLMALAINKAKEHFRNIKGLDPELAGWKGWVKSTAKKYYDEMKKTN